MGKADNVVPFKRRESRLQVQAGDLRKVTRVKWAWHNRIVMGGMNLLVGEPKVGKSTMVAWVLAQITKGKLPGCLQGSPCNVALIGNEDRFDQVWTPKVFAAGGNPGKLLKIKSKDFGRVDIDSDINDMAELIQEYGIVGIYFDQVLDNLGPGVDHYHAGQLRGALAPMINMCSELDTFTLVTQHPNKGGNDFSSIVGGSTALRAVPRSSLFLADHPSRDVKVLVQPDNNYGDPADPLEFQITSVTIGPPDVPIHVTHGRAVGWQECDDADSDDLVNAHGGSPKKKTAKSRGVELLLKGLLIEPREATYVFEAFREEGLNVSRKTIRKVAHSMGVQMAPDGYQGKSVWSLRPSQPAP